LNDIGPKGLISSIGSDGSLPPDRINRFCNIDETWGESNIFGCTSPEEVLERMIVSDG
jgi:hypothetical protein